MECSVLRLNDGGGAEPSFLLNFHQDKSSRRSLGRVAGTTSYPRVPTIFRKDPRKRMCIVFLLRHDCLFAMRGTGIWMRDRAAVPQDFSHSWTHFERQRSVSGNRSRGRCNSIILSTLCNDVPRRHRSVVCMVGKLESDYRRAPMLNYFV